MADVNRKDLHTQSHQLAVSGTCAYSINDFDTTGALLWSAISSAILFPSLDLALTTNARFSSDTFTQLAAMQSENITGSPVLSDSFFVGLSAHTSRH
jgi:hypothetical protein